jgi:type II secretory pathway pseudopilin PulG
MRRLQAGFLLVEILLSFLIITLFIGICMRYQVSVRGWQTQALTTMEVINRLDHMLDEYKNSPKDKIAFTTDRNISMNKKISPVSLPHVSGAPPNFNFALARSMKVMTLCASWSGQSGFQQCCMPLIFKKEDDDD